MRSGGRQILLVQESEGRGMHLVQRVSPKVLVVFLELQPL